MLVIYIVLLFMFFTYNQVVALVISAKHGGYVQEVPFGENVVLRCKSNDKNHLFEHWILDNDVIVGPSNSKYDPVKFNYEILSGNLTIRAVSKKDEGLYTCVSRAIHGNERKVDKINVMVYQDWENVYEHDSNINLIRILIVLITLLLLAIGAYVIYRMWKDRYKYPKYLEQEDDECTADDEEIYNEKTPSTSDTKNIVIDKNEHSISTDFKSILEKTSE